MKEADENTELFIRRIKNLTSAEENRVVDRLLEDPALKKEFDELSTLVEAVKLYGYQKEAEAYFKKKAVKSFPRTGIKIWRGAALLFMFTGLAFLGYLTFSGNYLPGIQVDAGVVRSGGNKPSPGQTEQEHAFEQFVSGQAYFAAKDFPKAIELFNEVLKTRDLRNQVREAVQWHLCVAYLSDGQIEMADFWMSEIEKIEDPKYKIAPLDKLKVKWQILIKEAFS